MKIFVGFLFTIVHSVNAEIPQELERTVKADLRKISFLLLSNIKNYSLLVKNDHPHAHMNVIELGNYYDYKTEIHTVVTDDGYILEMHRFTGNKTNPSPTGKQPVFLMHGLLGSSMDRVVTGPKRGLAFILVDLGYDVWMGNARGNEYSPNHKNISITEAEYWDFSFHEIGKYDLPTMIDQVLKTVKYKKIFYIGHSQASASFLAMLSEHPEYNDKIITMFALGSIAYLSHMTSPFMKTLAYLGPAIDIVFRLFDKYEFKPSEELFELFCDKNQTSISLCTNVLFLMFGYNEELLDKELLPAILAHIPAGSSTKQALHLSQLVKTDEFRQFDYGWSKNLKKYNSLTPPSYKLENVRVPISLHYSDNDWLSNPVDVQKLYKELPNAIGKYRIPHDKFNHLDYLYGLNIETLLYDEVINIMKRQQNIQRSL